MLVVYMQGNDNGVRGQVIVGSEGSLMQEMAWVGRNVQRLEK